MKEKKAEPTSEEVSQEEKAEQKEALHALKQRYALGRHMRIRAKDVISFVDNERAALEHAKLLFYLYHNPRDICYFLDIPWRTFGYHAYQKTNSWKKTRQQEASKLCEEALAGGVKSKYESVIGLSLSVVERHLKKLAATEADISTKDAKLASDIIANVDRIARLDRGDPTDIQRFESLTPEGVKDAARELLKEMAEEDPLSGFMEDGNGGESDRPTRNPKPSLH